MSVTFQLNETLEFAIFRDLPTIQTLRNCWMTPKYDFDSVVISYETVIKEKDHMKTQRDSTEQIKQEYEKNYEIVTNEEEMKMGPQTSTGVPAIQKPSVDTQTDDRHRVEDLK